MNSLSYKEALHGSTRSEYTLLHMNTSCVAEPQHSNNCYDFEPKNILIL